MIDNFKVYDKKEAEKDAMIAESTIESAKEILALSKKNLTSLRDRTDDLGKELYNNSQKIVIEFELRIRDPFDYHLWQTRYQDFKAGDRIFDPIEVYWMNIKLQYCQKHYQSPDYMTIRGSKLRIMGVHMQSLLLDTKEMTLFLIHRTDEISLPLQTNDLDRLNTDMYEKINFLSDTNISETFKGGYYSWYFCSKCISLDELKNDITKPNWHHDIQAKYGNIWIDWNLNKLG